MIVFTYDEKSLVYNVFLYGSLCLIWNTFRQQIQLTIYTPPIANKLSLHNSRTTKTEKKKKIAQLACFAIIISNKSYIQSTYSSIN